MDILSDVLQSIRLEGSVFFRSALARPWGMSCPANDMPLFHIVLFGHCWIQTDAMAEPIRVEDGDIVFIPRGEAHWIADSPGSPRIPSTRLLEAYQCGAPLFQEGEIATRLLCGYFRFDKGLGHPLMGALPPYLHVKPGTDAEYIWLRHMIETMDLEAEIHRPGKEVVVDRLCEILFIQILRRSEEGLGNHTNFLAALAAPAIRHALHLIHSQLDHPWTLEELAREAGASRAVFAARFHQLVGVPPKAYITSWRMHKATRLLEDRGLSLSDVAAEVGFASDSAFSKAFKRCFKIAPSALRQRMQRSLSPSLTGSDARTHR